MVRPVKWSCSTSRMDGSHKVGMCCCETEEPTTDSGVYAHSTYVHYVCLFILCNSTTVSLVLWCTLISDSAASDLEWWPILFLTQLPSIYELAAQSLCSALCSSALSLQPQARARPTSTRVFASWLVSTAERPICELQ